MKKIIQSISCLLFITCTTFAQSQLKIAGGNVKVSGDVNIVLQNTEWTNNGTFTATAGKVVFKGDATSADSEIKGSNETTFHNLTINKSAHDAKLGNNISIAQQLNLQSGLLSLEDNNLSFQSGAYTTAISGQTYIQTNGTGQVVQSIDGGTLRTFIVGNDTYTPISILNNGTSDNFSVRTAPEVLSEGETGSAYAESVVNRTWFIEEATPGGSDLTITAQWNAADEAQGFDRTDCFLSHYQSSWDMPASGAANGAGPFTLTRSGITELSPFAVFSDFILPVELLDFMAYAEGKHVQLEWHTAREVNNDYFTIERSKDGINFNDIGRMEGAGTYEGISNYKFLDTQPIAGLNYYRLRQVDFDGTSSYSELRLVDFEGGESLTVYPNPTSGILYFNTSEAPEDIRIIDAKGMVIRKITGSDAPLDLSDLPAGVYTYRVQLRQNVFIGRIVKQ